MTISYHLYFLHISNVWSMSHHGSVGQVQSKECYFMFKYSFLAFVLVAVVFHQKIGVFLFPFLFFDEVPHFHNRIFISQSETGIVDKNLSVELYDDHSLVHQ